MARTPKKKGPFRDDRISQPATPPPPAVRQPEPIKEAPVVEAPVVETVEVARVFETILNIPMPMPVPIPTPMPVQIPMPMPVQMPMPIQMPKEVFVGNLTNDMTKLRAEIDSARSQRNALMASARKEAATRHESVNEMMSSFRQSRLDAFQQAQTERGNFLKGLRNAVSKLQRDLSADLAGAGRIFRGA